ncbi:hypothetical protein GNZ12_13840 [Paraburkholderia sp. 1N]|uniref:Uncharacterized protein n=1 Tax=Paraburkholderia solitsugae TaxID=2675748 RepID=A0ABX2BRA6_9BURK|nr:hypothetical protein [Paraburkholderia solitsugae]NPT42368.1 hypothetical protein [Paraburkholderia solitsugae]
MQNNQHHCRLSFVDANYAHLPRPVHWVLNSMGVFLLAVPFLFMFLSGFLTVWGIDMLQSVIGMAGAGVVFALFDMLKEITSSLVYGQLMAGDVKRRVSADPVDRLAPVLRP